MPINKVTATKRGKAAIVAAFIAAAGGTWGTYQASQPPVSVVLAVDSLIKPWEGLVLKSHWDPFAKIFDICYGETRINGKPVTDGLTRTPEQCEQMLITRVQRDYYAPLTRCIADFDKKPVSLQASAISGAYNFGVNGMCNSTAARYIRVGKYREACEAQTAWNRAGGQIVNGLVKRREMGDAQRIGEAELCVSGI